MNDHERELADTLSELEEYSNFVIALLELFAERAPTGLPGEDDGELVRIGAFVDSAVNALREACKTNTIAAHQNARKKVAPLLDEMLWEVANTRLEATTLLCGLVCATQSFLSEHWLLDPIGDEPSARPAHDTQAGGASDERNVQHDRVQQKARAAL